jgi:hypothetical protein
MIVPQFWAEGRVQGNRDGRQVTVRRFGWSDTSQADAQANADNRAAEALQRLLSGDSIARREPKVPYNGAAGVPIREEIVGRHGDTIITRNSYGARCLNSPNVLFADVDYSLGPPLSFGCITLLILVSLASLVGGIASSWQLAVVLCIVAIIATWPITVLQHRRYIRKKGGLEAAARLRIDQFVERNPDWALRVYRTPAGLRLIATHRTFDPSAPEVREFFADIGADPVYVRMCLNQQCFRARVSPKPWRIGIDRHIRPRPGVWPVNPERLPDRRAWIETFEAAATEFAACEYIESIGSGIVSPEVAPVVKLHDEMSRANSGLPTA